MKKIFILGTRGIPAKHGGFETFAEKLALFLVEQGDWSVTVYCQEQGTGKPWHSVWRGVELVHIPVANTNALGAILFDWKSIKNALTKHGIFLLLGYNTALFNLVQKIAGQVVLINMDGMEWQRRKWGLIAKIWLWLNERAGCVIGSHLIADHPCIQDHLHKIVRKDRVSMIPYGADEILEADAKTLVPYKLIPGKFSIIIARLEPENSVLEMVSAFSRKVRNHTLVVVGDCVPDEYFIHKQIINCASEEVIFLGAIYDKAIINALRFYCRIYLHGHTVWGTNPSLVEALGAGCAVMAHDNKFNRWVAGKKATYFNNEQSCADLLDFLLINDHLISQMQLASRVRFHEQFEWDMVLYEYEKLLNSSIQNN